MSKVPGVNAQHAIITPECRSNKGARGAFDEAVERMLYSYQTSLRHNLRQDAVHEPTYHLVLSVEWKKL